MSTAESKEDLSVYSLRVLKVGEAKAVGPISFYMSHWDELEYSPHFIWLAQDEERTVLVNTGLPQDPEDLRILNVSCRAAHPENYFAPDHIWPPQQVLAQVGVEPVDVDAILVTAMGAYATGNLENIFECRDALERIRKEADIVIPGHDPEVLVRYPGGIIA